MKNKAILAAMAAALFVQTAIPAAASAQRHDRQERHDKHDRNDRIYRGGDGRYYCKRDNGTTGLVIGGLAGGALGNIIGGNTLGTLLGAGGGALLGRQIDRGDVKCR